MQMRYCAKYLGLVSKTLVIYSWVWVCLVSPRCG